MLKPIVIATGALLAAAAPGWAVPDAVFGYQAGNCLLVPPSTPCNAPHADFSRPGSTSFSGTHGFASGDTITFDRVAAASGGSVPTVSFSAAASFTAAAAVHSIRADIRYFFQVDPFGAGAPAETVPLDLHLFGTLSAQSANAFASSQAFVDLVAVGDPPSVRLLSRRACHSTFAGAPCGGSQGSLVGFDTERTIFAEPGQLYSIGMTVFGEIAFAPGGGSAAISALLDPLPTVAAGFADSFGIEFSANLFAGPTIPQPASLGTLAAGFALFAAARLANRQQRRRPCASS